VKLAFVEVCGFRGFREKVRVDFGGGFTVITGRNGVGKSTLCDAVEFALTGSIAKYTIEKAAQESLTDYIWWRGDGTPRDHYVTVCFAKTGGGTFTVTRSRNSGATVSPEQIEAELCDVVRPDDALQQLCRTSIIRDEWIAALSLDLSETARFDLVRSALGPVQGVDFGANAKEVLKVIAAQTALRQTAYENGRAQLTTALTQLAEAKEAIARAGDVSAAMETLNTIVPGGPIDLATRLEAGRAALVTSRARLGLLGEALASEREVATLQQSIASPEASLRRDSAKSRLEVALASLADAERVANEAEKALELEEHANELAAALAAMVEHAERLGLHNDRCPLCAATRSHDEYVEGLSLARIRIDTLSSGLAAARQRALRARETCSKAAAELELAKTFVATSEAEQSRLAALAQERADFFGLHQLDTRFLQQPNDLEEHIASERARLIDLERALLTLEVSQSTSRLAALEDRIVNLRREAEVAAAEVAKSERALAVAKSVDRGVRSVSGEIIDEQLALISPLLNELYQRLRPHHDWRSIEYSIRGDVRRFLSLKVGDGLNPQFVFSSGQRRAAGLAFLLSVHLARAWTPWRTLLLDDPVQHIDDFRALHLIEVLAALRMDGRQIVCAVEDPDLADLLCRRLQATADASGKRIDIDISLDGVATVVADVDVPPLPSGVLRSRRDIQAVG
jgi:DNA repair exonuclease SbcCD ATPase subunit